VRLHLAQVDRPGTRLQHRVLDPSATFTGLLLYNPKCTFGIPHTHASTGVYILYNLYNLEFIDPSRARPSGTASGCGCI